MGLFVLLLVGAALRVAGPAAAPHRTRAAALTGLAAAAALLLWPGSLLYVGMVQAYLVVQLLATREPAAARLRAGTLATLHATACAVLLPFCAGRSWAQFGAVSPLVLSNFQPLWFGAGAAALGLVSWLWSQPALGAARPRRLGSAFGLAGLGLAAAWLFVPDLADSLSNAAGWFEPDPDPFLGVVAEIQPLLFSGGPFDPGLAHDLFSYLFWVYPLAALWLGLRAVRARCGEVGLLLVWSAGACALALAQGRFTDVAGPAFALVLGPALLELVRAVRRRFPARRAVAVAVMLLCGAAAVSPHARDYRGHLLVSLAARRGGSIQYTPRVRQRFVLERVARWLRQNTPESGGYLDPTARPAYGVLSAWGHGHLLRYYAERPMVEDNFGTYAGAPCRKTPELSIVMPAVAVPGSTPWCAVTKRRTRLVQRVGRPFLAAPEPNCPAWVKADRPRRSQRASAVAVLRPRRSRPGWRCSSRWRVRSAWRADLRSPHAKKR